MKRIILTLIISIILAGCAGTQGAKQSDGRLDKAIAESDKNKSQKLDFLKDEKLPNEEYVPSDSGLAGTKTVDGFSEIPPTLSARFRIQLFSGSAENAHKMYRRYTSERNSTDVYVVYESESKTWKVWAGNFMTKNEADNAKTRLIEAGYEGAWVREMPAAEKKTTADQELFWVQLGSYQKESSAQQLFQKISGEYKDQVIIKTVGETYKVWIGGFSERSSADKLKAKLNQSGYPGVFVVQGLE